MALKERLDALKRPEITEAGGPERGLSVIPGRQPAVEGPTTPTPDESQKEGRGANTIANTKAALPSLLFERHADGIEIGGRRGGRQAIASLTEEDVRTAA